MEQFDDAMDEYDLRRGAFRAGRGMMEPAILSALAERPMHGYEIISYLEEKSHGIWRPSPGSVYPTLQMLEERGDVTSDEHGGKKVYTLTDSGRESAKAAEAEARQTWKQRLPSMHEYQRHFHKEAGEIIKLMRQVFRKGSQEQREAMDEAVKNFRNRLEQIVKGDM